METKREANDVHEMLSGKLGGVAILHGDRYAGFVIDLI